ncbi:MAG: U3 snoRNP protein [Thelocarpon impressellum]|nr:MAG: U3 snoRNP protein [Thelocarpon impressellum]
MSSVKPLNGRRGGTDSSRHHRFESFSQRISKLHIDPVRRVRRHDLQDDPSVVTTSYFKSALDEWDDLNTSESFSDFVRQVSPLCESLPQVLHFQDRIADQLLHYIEKWDALSLEPLLALLAHFAHDLGVRFEKFFSRSLALVASLAARHPDVDVIEWAFTCLAWLFKYLSRLLVPNLRPTYDLMAPLLGREQQKPFVTRFAAEAMSFLVRKSGTAYAKDPGPLERIITHAVDDLTSSAGSRYALLYQQGLMSLFSEAIKGVNRGIHSSGPTILKIVIDASVTAGKESPQLAEGVACGVLINLIHHTEPATFTPIWSMVEKYIDDMSSRPEELRLAGRLLFAVAGVRKGSRVTDWRSLLEACHKLLALTANSRASMGSDLAMQTIAPSAVALHYAPMEVTTSHFRSILDVIVADDRNFLPFCNLFAELGHERFGLFVLPYLQRFFVDHWRSSEDAVCVLIAKLSRSGSLAGPDRTSAGLICPASWQAHMSEAFDALAASNTDTDRCLDESAEKDLLFRCRGYLDLLSHLKFDASVQSRISTNLHRLLRLTLQQSSPMDGGRDALATGSGFLTYVNTIPADQVPDQSLWPLLCSSGSPSTKLPAFLQALHLYIERSSPHLQLDEDRSQSLIDALVDNLSGPSHEVRALSLRVLQLLYSMKNRCTSETLSLALLIEETPLTLQAARGISMHVRTMAANFSAASSDPWLKLIVPRFFFGLLSFKMSQVWEDASAALGVIAGSKEGEEEVVGLAIRWLETPQATNLGELEKAPSEAQKPQLTSFQCSNVLLMERLLADSVMEVDQARPELQRRLVDEQEPAQALPSTARSKALRVLSVIPHIAEKRSRQLVPMFLEWATRHEETSGVADGGSEDDSAEASPAVRTEKWSRRDQKAMLGLLAKFTNPRVLYRASEVHSSLLELLSNGDIDIQKPTLEAIFTWKSPGVVTYEEDLRNLLDDARFGEIVTNFVQASDEAKRIQEEHRSELMPVLLRMLYGRIIARKGAASGKRGMAGRRKMVLKALAAFPDSELGLFISVALGPLADLDSSGSSKEVVSSRRRQIGTLKMIEDLVGQLGARLVPFTRVLLRAVLQCLIGASQAKATIASEEISVGDGTSDSGLLRAIRQTGYRSLNLLFSSCTAFDWQPYMPTIFRELIAPRLENLPIETAQAPSAILQLFSTWSSTAKMVLYLSDYDKTALKRVADCLAVPSAKEEVKLYAIGIVGHILDLLEAENDVSDSVKDRVRAELLQPNIDIYLTRLGEVLSGNPGKELLESAVETAYRLAKYVTSSAEVRNMVSIALFLLDQPLRRVSPKTKSDLLRVLQHLLPLYDSIQDGDLGGRIFKTVSSLFGFFRDRQSRAVLSEVLLVFARHDSSLAEVAELCAELNSFSDRRVDEPDFDRRFRAFNRINEDGYKAFTPRQWTPILYNMLYYVKDNEELAIRTNASFSLRRFVEAACLPSDTDVADFKHLLSSILLPAIRTGVRESSELIRTEYMAVLAHAVSHFPEHPDLSDLRTLLVGGDEEASFFGNILHIQQHRRLRALRRLAGEAQQGHLSSGNISHLLVPLIEHFITDRTDDGSAQNLAAETVTTIGLLLEWVEWPQFKAILRRFVGNFQSQPEPEKITIRLLGVSVDSLSRAAARKARQAADGSENLGALVNGVDQVHLGGPAQSPRQSTLAATMPLPEKLGPDLTTQFLPPMIGFLHNKDESFVSLRIPVAVTAVKLLKLLPPIQLSERLPPVLTDISHILRSRAQESRDLTRKTLAEVTTLLGAEYFGFVLKELRGALGRGYQLHVLSYTVHSILVANSAIFGPGDLDYCLPQIVGIIMDDIFGTTGQEKDAEEYISKMKEVKSSKSYDSMELITKTATLQRLSDLIKPIQALLQEKLSHKLVRKIDELLRRVGAGLLRNDAVQSRDIFVFCYELIHSVSRPNSAGVAVKTRGYYKMERYLVNLKGAKRSEDRCRTTVYTYKIVRFSLDIMRAVLHKHEALQTPSNLAGFVPIIKDSLLQAQEEVQISALRLLTAIIKVPLPELDQDTELYMVEATKFIKAAPSTNTELAQASLKLISAILRERRRAQVDERKLNSRLATLLGLLKPDLEEPDRQGVTFNFLKAVMARKVMVPEVYDVMDTVAAIMVTNQTRGARDLARGCYFQFLMEYPQGEKRFAKQMAFLVKNLDYRYPEGRQSVLEVIHLLIFKVGDKMVQDVIATFFVPLVMALINDESQDCREMAGVLLKETFERADLEKRRSFLGLLRGWVGQAEQTLLTRVALQCYGFYFEVHREENEASMLLTRIASVLQSNMMDAEAGDWELLYFALQIMTKLGQLFPDQVLALEAKGVWAGVEECLSYPHVWVKLSAAKLLGLYLADFARTNATSGLESLPLVGSGGIRLDAQDMLRLTRRSLGILRTPSVTDELATQSVRNLVFLGRCLEANALSWSSGSDEPAVAEQESGSDEDVAEHGTDGDGRSGALKTALQHLLERLSSILRREPPNTKAASLVPKTAALQLIGTLCAQLPTSSLSPSLPTILLPLHNLTDASIAAPHSSDAAFTSAYKALQTTSQELKALLQSRLGTSAYVDVYAAVQKGVRERREGRRTKRRIGAVTEPERREAEKRRKGERKRERRKDRSGEERGRRRGW